MKKSICCVVYCLFSCWLFFNSCKKTRETQTACNYSSDIKKIVTAKCALSGCHGSGSTLGDFTSYDNLKLRVDNGRIRLNVFELKIMPPASADSLSAKEKEQLKCWLDNGAAQN